jgi:Arc/MetJ-type ribon-helix-helix transcriptional regulator
MTDTEKITINMSAVDLGQIDLLVDEGFYSNRSDFIRTAIRNQISQHSEVLKQSIARRTMAVGVLVYDSSDLEKYRARGEMIEIRLMGVLVLNGVSPDLARATIKTINIKGVFRTSDEVKAALADRMVS